MPTYRENTIQMMLCDFVKMQYPNSIFVSDGAGENRTTMAQRIRAKRLRSTTGYPDFFLAEPRGIYHGLFLELKQEGYKLRKSRTDEWVSPHISAQAECHKKLQAAGYYADFSIGLDSSIETVKRYMGLKPSMSRSSIPETVDKNLISYTEAF